MPLEFPASPNDGDIYDSGSRRWQWSNSTWIGLGESISQEEKLYWQCLAVMLEPNALGLIKGASGTVPENEYWVVLHAWRVKWAGASNYQFIRQVFPGCMPLVLPPGTDYDASYSAGANEKGCITYYALSPGILGANPGYDANPKGLYYSRAFNAISGPIVSLTLQISDNSEQTVNVPLSGGYFVTSSSFQDCAWMGFYDGLQTSLTLLPERNDNDPFRFASPHLIALHTDLYPAFSARGAGVTGGSAGCTISQAGD